MSVIKERFPVKYMEPLNNLVNRELSLYKSLLDRIKASVEDLLANLNGEYPRPFEIEELWHAVKENRIPRAWTAVSFPTAAKSLSDFLIELCRKLNYWTQLTDTGIEKMSNFWLPAFFEPGAMLEAFRQTRARQEGIPLSELKNVLEILEKPFEEVSHEEEKSGE